MKPLFRNAYLLIISSFVSWLSMGCTNSSSTEATPQSGCRIQKSVAVSKSKFFDQTNQATYEYDSRGNLAKTVAMMDKRPTSGIFGGQTGTTTTSYTYDADGYLTASTTDELYITTTDKTIREQFITATSYSYSNGRLAAYTLKSTNAQDTTITAFAYIYNSAGDLTQMTNFNPANPSRVLSTYVYQKNQLVDYIEGYGTSERHPYTIENGLVTKSIIPGSSDELVLVAMFDSQQRIIKREEYHNTQLQQYDVQTWSDAKPALASLPSFKGFPAVIFSVFSGQPGVLATRKSFYWNSVRKIMEPYNEIVHAVLTNAQGFVTNDLITVNHSNPAAAEQDYTITETYIYTGCR